MPFRRLGTGIPRRFRRIGRGGKLSPKVLEVDIVASGDDLVEEFPSLDGGFDFEVGVDGRGCNLASEAVFDDVEEESSV